jgi:hypothetical protein
MHLLMAFAVIVTLSVPGRSNSTPTIAAAGAFVAVTWSASAPGGSTDIYVAVSRDGGRAFGAPVRVNDVAGDARVNGEQPPQVSLISRAAQEPAVAIVWTTKGANGTRLVYARSDDGGRSFAGAALLAGTDAPGNRGWQATAVAPNGRVYAMWLDHRELASDSGIATSHHEHRGGAASGEKPDGVAMAQKSKLYFASLDGSVTARAVTGGVCYCCKTALAAGKDGAVYAAWRHVYPGNLRDMAFTLSRDGGRTFAPPIRVSEDKWAIEGCPDDGPAMALDDHNRIHLAWPTLVADRDGEPTIGIFYAWSRDGRTFTARERVPAEGLPHHPRAVVSGGMLIIAWDESKDGTRKTVVARRALGTTGAFSRQVVSGEASGIYPVLTPVHDGVLVAWSSGAGGAASAIHVTRISN